MINVFSSLLITVFIACFILGLYLVTDTDKLKRKAGAVILFICLWLTVFAVLVSERGL